MTRTVLIIEDNPGIGELVRMQVADLGLEPVLVNTHINRLRNKIEADPADPHFVQTVWGVGYRFMD
jgi:hypothetical protein|tara:strand:- start:138 stop:335 length:198 start_codon:yes stop_codon:yes gene_type:complete